MGGALACWLATRHRDISAVVLVNPLVEGLDPFLREMGEELLAAGTEITDGVASDIAKEGSTELAYSALPIRASLSLFEGAARTGEDLGLITSPILLFSSRNDHVLQASNGDAIEERSGGKVQRVWLENSFHVATIDNDAPEINRLTVEFLLNEMERT